MVQTEEIINNLVNNLMTPQGCKGYNTLAALVPLILVVALYLCFQYLCMTNASVYTEVWRSGCSGFSSHALPVGFVTRWRHQSKLLLPCIWIHGIKVLWKTKQNLLCIKTSLGDHSILNPYRHLSMATPDESFLKMFINCSVVFSLEE